MTKHKKFLILALILVCITGVITWFITPAFNMYLLYSRLESEGLEADAKIVEGEIRADPSFLGIFTSYTEDHQFRIEFKDLGGKVRQSALGVSTSTYERYRVGDYVQVLYLREGPSKCRVAAYVGSTKLISKYVLVCGAVVWLFFVLVSGIIGAFLITRAGGAMDIVIKVKEMKCPECLVSMEEGYIPVTSGINWRRKGESVGMLTVFSGLPGTVW